MLPASLVRERLAEKVAEVEESEARHVGRKEQARIREELLLDLLPKAFTRSSLTYAYIDEISGWVVVDASAAKRAEELLSLLRTSLGSLSVRPMAVNRPAETVMTGWLADKSVPENLVVGSECELREPGENGGIVRCRNQDLFGSEIREHLQVGKKVARLALEWQERINFVLDTDLVLRRVRFDDELKAESLDRSEDEASRFDADFALMGLELSRLLPELLEMFGGMTDELEALREAV